MTEVAFPDGVRLDFLGDLKRRHPRVAVVVFSNAPVEVYAGRARRRGAHAWVSKAEEGDVLVATVRKVLEGSAPAAPTPRVGAETESLSLVEGFTDRELRVYELIGQGLGTSRIAEVLHLSTKTIESHKARLKRKLVLQSSAELQVQAVEWLRAASKAPLTPTGEDPQRRSAIAPEQRRRAYQLIPSSGEPVLLDPVAPLTIGRSESAQVRLGSSFVSREQARVAWDVVQGWIVQDLGSRNGTFVNGHPIKGECLLRCGDTLHVAGVMFRFRAELEEADRPSDVTETWVG